jgi:hypothetical protein
VTAIGEPRSTTRRPPVAASDGDRPEPESPRQPPWRWPWRPRRIVAVALVAGLLWASPSYLRALTYPGSAPWSDRTVEWIRTNGGSRVVTAVEQWYYSHHKASPGDARAALRHLPARARGLASPPVAPPRAVLPAAVRPATPHPLPGEGVWTPQGPTRSGRTTLETTAFRPNARDQNMVVGAAWMDAHALRATLVAGTVVPGGSGWPWPADVPFAVRPHLVAAFNAGFKFQDTPGGFYADGRTAVPLVRGLASFVVEADGTPTVGQWGRDVRAGPGVRAVRQNLRLIVDHGGPVGDLVSNTEGAYGTRRQQLQYTWRSGIGIDRHGNLVYVAGAGLDLRTLAAALVDAGATRGMQLDIHDGKATFNIFRPAPGPLGAVGTKLMPNMQRPATRYLQPDQRDFVAMTVR